MGFWQYVGDAFIANLRAGGNASVARREFNRIRAERQRRNDLITLAIARWIAAAGRELQYIDGDAKVQVTSGWSRDHKCDTTDIIVTHRAKGGKEHLHIVFDDYGNVLHESWTGNH